MGIKLFPVRDILEKELFSAKYDVSVDADNNKATIKIQTASGDSLELILTKVPSKDKVKNPNGHDYILKKFHITYIT